MESSAIDTGGDAVELDIVVCSIEDLISAIPYVGQISVQFDIVIKSHPKGRVPSLVYTDDDANVVNLHVRILGEHSTGTVSQT